MSDEIDRAVQALENGELVVYPTETVYGLGSDGLDDDAVEKVFAAKNRPRQNPVSLAVPTVDQAEEILVLSERSKRFMHEFLPGPITVLGKPTIDIPPNVTAGNDVLGVRVPDHPVAKELLVKFSPVTATSANISGHGSVTHPDTLDTALTDKAAEIIDAGESPGGESTVVNPETATIVRRGVIAERIEEWFQT